MHEAVLKRKPEGGNEPPEARRRPERASVSLAPVPGIHTAGPAAVPFPAPAVSAAVDLRPPFAAEEEAERTATPEEASAREPEEAEPAAPEKAAEKPLVEKEAAAGAETEGEPAAEEVSDASAGRLAGVLAKVDKTAQQQKGPAARPVRARKAATKAAADASAAAPSPDEEPLAKGKAAKIGTMNDPEKKGKVEKEDFLALVREKLRRMAMPTNPSQMAAFKEAGGAKDLGKDLVGGVQEQKRKSMGGLEAAARAEPQPAEKRVPAAEPAADAGPGAGRLDAQEVLPLPRTEAEISLDADRDEMEATLGRENLSPSRLRKANDPRFDAVQDGREEVHAQAAAGPARYRAEETSYLAEQKTAVLADEKEGKGAMRGTRRNAGARVLGAQRDQMSAEEQKRQKFVADVDAIYAKTQKTVDDKLLWLDGEVDRRFTAGEAAAREAFETYVDVEFRAWKRRRYKGARGKVRWVVDRFRDINELSGAKKVYTDGQDVYYKKLDETIKDIGTLVDTTLAWCLEETRKGDEKVRDYFKNLDAGVKTLVADAFAEVLDRFGDLKSRVEDHREALVDKLVQRYQESREKLDARIEEIKQSHRSLYVRVKRKIEAVIEAIRNFKNRLMAVLARAADVVGMILDDPIDFLANLLKAVKTGFDRFAGNIWEHLKQGVFGWLFGTLASAGIQVPGDFSPKSIFGLILQVAGITYDHVRERAVKMVGERNAAAIERVAGYLSTLFREGPAGLWAELREDLSDLKDTVLDSVREWVVTRIVTAAVTKLVSMFNPVGAIIQAVLAIYNVVRFFIERIDQILELVNSIIDSLALIVRGDVEAAAAFIERSLALTIPLIISFLARLIGLGGVAERVKSIIQRVRRRVDRAIDKMLRKVAVRFLDVAAKAKTGLKKLVEWWKVRKKFRQEGEEHTLYFEGADEDAKLMMASRPMPLEDYVQNRFKGKVQTGQQVPVSESDRKTLREVARLLARVDNLKNTVPSSATEPAYDHWKARRDHKDLAKKRRSTEPEPASIGQKRGEQISRLLTRIAELLSTLSGSPENDVRPPTKVSWSTQKTTLRNGRVAEDGRRMVASPLSINPGSHAGSVPRDESPLWTEVNRRPRKYIRGHLLNHNLHGPGTFQNMTPIPGGDNSRMEPLERRVKDAVLEKNLVVSYSVVAEYRGHANRVHLPDEEHIPTAIRLTAYPLRLKASVANDPAAAKDPDNWVQGETEPNGADGLPMRETLTITLPEDDEIGATVAVKRVSLSADNSARRSLVIAYVKENVPGIGMKRATKLVDSRPQSEDDLKKLTDDDGRPFVDADVIAKMKEKNVLVGADTTTLFTDSETSAGT